jgi:hypothetical protein
MRAISKITSSNASSEPVLAGAPLRLRVDRRARRLRLRLDVRSRGLVLTIPAGISRRRALAWAATHQDWAERALLAVPEQAPLGPGSVVPLYGRAHVVEWCAEWPRKVVIHGDILRIGGPLEGIEGRLVRWLRAEALAVLTEETREYAGKLGEEVAGVAVGDPRSRWGSCTSGGKIRYSWRLILAPDFVRRATVAHEVAHLVHMDHGPSFHALLRELFGADPKPAREWLRREGGALHRMGR